MADFYNLDWVNHVPVHIRSEGRWLWNHGRVAELARDDETVYGIVLDDHRYYAQITVEDDEEDWDDDEDWDDEEDEDWDDDDDRDWLWDRHSDEDDEDDEDEDGNDEDEDWDDEDEDDEDDEDGWDDEDEDEDGLSFWCSCGSDGVCAHVAALFAALDDGADIPEDHFIDDTEPEPNWEEMLSNMKRSDLRDLLTTLATEDPRIRERIYLQRQKAPIPGCRIRWKMNLQRILEDSCIEYSTPDEDDPYDLAVEIRRYLDETIAALLKVDRIQDAFDLVCIAYDLVYHYLDDVEADDEDEDESLDDSWIWNNVGLRDKDDTDDEDEEDDEDEDEDEDDTIIAPRFVLDPSRFICIQTWSELFQRADPKTRDSMFAWFQRNLETYQFTFLHLFCEPGWSKDQLTQIRAQAEHAFDDDGPFHSEDFDQPSFLADLVPLLLNTGMSEKQLTDFFREKCTDSSVHIIAWTRLMASNLPHVLTVYLKACKPLFRNEMPVALTTSVILAAIYRTCNQTDKAAAEIQDTLFSLQGLPAQDAIELSNMLKELLPETEWPSVLMKILNHPNLKHIRNELRVALR